MVKIIIGAVFEVVWVVGLTHSSNVLEWIVTLIAIVISFYLLITASKALPVGTSYAVYVGLVLRVSQLLILYFRQPVVIGKIILIITLIIGVVGLKLVTPEGRKVKWLG